MRTAIHLAFNELWRNRLRFLLFSLVVALITVLILFIAALGEGLGSGNREYLQKLNADLIVYQDTARLQIAGSRINFDTRKALRGVQGVKDVGAIGFASASVMLAGGARPLDVAIIGVEPGRPGEPPALQGQRLLRRSGNDAIIDRTVAAVTRAKVGDSITLRTTLGNEFEFYNVQVVGISDSRKYGLRPSVILPIVTWERIRSRAQSAQVDDEPASHIAAVQLEDPTQIETMRELLRLRAPNTEAVDRQTAYENTPGYREQQSTLNTQNGFALLIGMLVIGGFFQIQTLQKVPQIGMLKAIGTPNGVVALTVLAQIVIVTLVGIIIGAAASFSLALFMPPQVPIIFEPRSGVLAIASIFLMGPLGGLVSVRYSLRVEPLIALGLNQ